MNYNNIQMEIKKYIIFFVTYLLIHSKYVTDKLSKSGIEVEYLQCLCLIIALILIEILINNDYL